MSHNFRITVLEDVVTPDFDLTVARLGSHSWLTPEVDKFPPEVTLVLWHVSVKR